MGNVSITCTRCHGAGTVELNGVFADTLVLMRQRKGEVTGAELAREVGCAGPAMNNRLAALERLGLLTSRRYGRIRLYKVKR